MKFNKREQAIIIAAMTNYAQHWRDMELEFSRAYDIEAFETARCEAENADAVLFKCKHDVSQLNEASFEENLDELLKLSNVAATLEEHSDIVRKMQKLFEDNALVAHKLGVETSASYYDNPVNKILNAAARSGINTHIYVSPHNWLPSSWEQC